MSTVICYKLKNPMVFNKGTKWESSCSTFLAYYTAKNEAEAQKEVDEINATHPEKLFNGEKINWDEIEKFYVDKQEEMY